MLTFSHVCMCVSLQHIVLLIQSIVIKKKKCVDVIRNDVNQFSSGYSKSKMKCLIERVLFWEGQIHHWTSRERNRRTLIHIKWSNKTSSTDAQQRKKTDNYQTSMISCSARRAFITVDSSLLGGFVKGIWENVFKVRGIVVEGDNGESRCDGMGEEKYVTVISWPSGERLTFDGLAGRWKRCWSRWDEVVS